MERRRGASGAPAIFSQHWCGEGPSHRGSVWHPESGQATAEAAIAFPLLLLVAIGLVQFALFTHAQNVVLEAAQEGARVAASADRTVEDGAASTVRLLQAGLGRSAAGVSVQAVDGDDVVAVEAIGRLRVIIPWAADATLPLHARAVVAKERFRPGGRTGG